MLHFNRHQVFVMLVSAIALCVSVAMVVFAPREEGVPPIDLSAVPMLGSVEAPVQMVLFEDLSCCECREFHLSVLPQIKSRYIETGKVKCFFVVLAFLENSMPLAQASLAIYEKNPEQFFPFVAEIFSRGEGNGLGGIDEDLLRQARSSAHLSETIDANDALGKKWMKSDYATPTVFINGVMVKDSTAEVIFEEIERALGRDHEKAAG